MSLVYFSLMMNQYNHQCSECNEVCNNIMHRPYYSNESDVDGIMNGNDRLRYYLYLIVEHRLFNVTLIFLILLNTVFIGIYISVDGRSGYNFMYTCTCCNLFMSPCLV